MIKHLSSLFILLLEITGCDSAPEQNTSGQAQPVIIDGFFSDLERFYKIDSIRQIGGKQTRPVAAMERLNIRHEMIIENHADLIKGARVLDFGSYDGRWTYALLEAGAKHVTGIEINQDFVDQATTNMTELGVPDDGYDYIVGDLLAELRKIEPGTYDGILNAGIFYHITYHVELMKEMERLDIKWVIVDSTVQLDEKPIVQWSLSPYGLEGTPSLSAILLMAEQVGFKSELAPIPANESVGMWDYNEGYRVTLKLLPSSGTT